MRIAPKRKPNQKHRIKTDKRYNNRLWRKIREQVIVRDNFTCKACNKLLELHTRDLSKQAHVDHIIRVKEGGTDELDNLQTLCKRCHDKKSAKERYE